MCLEVTTDGRHITFILVSLYEAGYGVHVVGAPFVFRELMLLRKSVPMPFVVGGKERDCGLSITDRPSTLASRPSTLFVLDYDFFSGLNKGEGSHGGTANTEVGEELGKNESGENFKHTLAAGRPLGRLPQGSPKGEMSGSERVKLHEYTRIEAQQAGQRLAGQAGASEPASLASELADSPVSESLTRSANNPALAYRAGELGSEGGNQPADSVEFLEGQSQAGLQIDKQKSSAIRAANDPSASGENSSFELRLPLGASPCGATSGCSSSRLPERSVVPIRDIRGKNSSSPATSHSPLATALRAPYFMHPSVYHRGLHKRQSPSTALDARRSTLDSAAKQRRRFRLGFFGTHDREFYTKHYHFPGMNRFEILEVFFQKFGDRITHLRGFPRDWDPCEMAVSIDARGGDRRGKSFLSQDHYFEALRECDFVLSPPGWCMPVSHNLVESMFCGAIPITNAGSFMAEPLTDGVNCLEFEDAVGLVSVIEWASAMDSGEVSRMQEAVQDYYERFLEPQALAERLRQSDCGKILVNAEENSVPLVFTEFYSS